MLHPHIFFIVTTLIRSSKMRVGPSCWLVLMTVGVVSNLLLLLLGWTILFFSRKLLNLRLWAFAEFLVVNLVENQVKDLVAMLACILLACIV